MLQRFIVFMLTMNKIITLILTVCCTAQPLVGSAPEPTSSPAASNHLNGSNLRSELYGPSDATQRALGGHRPAIIASLFRRNSDVEVNVAAGQDRGPINPLTCAMCQASMLGRPIFTWMECTCTSPEERDMLMLPVGVRSSRRCSIL